MQFLSQINQQSREKVNQLSALAALTELMKDLQKTLDKLPAGAVVQQQD